MKVGDLVVMPHRLEKFNIGGVGLVMDSTIVRNRIPVLWSDDPDKEVYEPICLLEVISESEFSK